MHDLEFLRHGIEMWDIAYSRARKTFEGKSNKIESCEEQCTEKKCKKTMEEARTAVLRFATDCARCIVQVQEESMKEYSEGGNVLKGAIRT